MRITIVGSGYIGLALAQHMQAQGGVHLTLTTTSPGRLAELEPHADQVLVARADDPAALQAALADAEAAVFCLAPTGDRQVDAAGYRSTYRDGMATLQALLPALPQLRQIVYTGSCSVYGDAGGGWVDETTLVAPADEHGQILLESEALLADCRSSSRRVCVLRLGAIHGPGRELADRFEDDVGVGRVHGFGDQLQLDPPRRRGGRRDSRRATRLERGGESGGRSTLDRGGPAGRRTAGPRP